MTIITTVTNPVDDSEVTLATGKVKRILYKEATPAQKKYDTTHNASIILEASGEDDVFVNLSLKIKEGQEPQIRYAEGKKGSETWHTLNMGDEVKIQMKDVNVVKDKTYYQTSLSRIKVTKRAEGSQAASKGAGAQSQQISYKKRDTTGMETGHAVNGALELKRSGVKGDVFDLSKIVHEATVTLKKEVAEQKGVDVTDYDLGASVGHAILNACRDFSGKSADTEQLIVAAKEVLAVAEQVTDFIKNGGVTEPKEEKKEEVKPKKETKKVVEEPPMDFDDDIPFAPIGLPYGRNFIHCI